MKLANFEKCIVKLGLELISVTLSSRQGGTVNRALAVRRAGKKKCDVYCWYCGCCRKSIARMSYAEVRENHAVLEAKAPNLWIPFQEYNEVALEQRFLRGKTLSSNFA